MTVALKEPPISTMAHVDEITPPSGDMSERGLNFITGPSKFLRWWFGFIASISRVTDQSEASKRVAGLWDEVDRMRWLDHDWNGYGSEAPNKEARDLAQTILLSTATIVVPSRVVASAQGGVGLCFYGGRKYADIECLNTGEILATISDGSGNPYVWEVKLNETKGALDRIGQFIAS